MPAPAARSSAARAVPGLHPSKLSSDGSVRVVAITAGQHHSLFLLSDGRVFGCGRCDGCELGLDASHPAMKEVKQETAEWKARRTEELKVEMAAWQKKMALKKEKSALATHSTSSARRHTGSRFSS